MAGRSAGILLHRGQGDALEVLLVHPGGPLWARRDAGAWSIPKGEYGPRKTRLAQHAGSSRRKSACRRRRTSPWVRRGQAEVRQGRAAAWALAATQRRVVHSNTFTLEWPPRSGQIQEFPEVDRAQWFALPEAGEKINPAQVTLLHDSSWSALLSGAADTPRHVADPARCIYLRHQSNDLGDPL